MVGSPDARGVAGNPKLLRCTELGFPLFATAPPGELQAPRLKERRQTYYELLNAVRLTGEWEPWLEFFADAVLASATQAVTSARRLLELASADAQRIAALGRAAASALAIHQALQRRPIATAASLAAPTGLTPATVNKSLVHLERIGVVAELTRKLRGRVFSYARYTEILNEGMGLPRSGQ